MATLDLSRKEEEFGDSYEVSIKNYVHGKEGGVVLDMTGFPDDVVHMGHGVINDGTASAPNYKPQPIDGTLHTKLVGVVRSTTKKSMPSTGVMTHGTINSNATKYPFNAASLTALRDLGIYNQVD